MKTYFSDYKGYYFTGDGCRRDADGYYWITGRVDDVLNVSGHRMGTAEVESALVAHPKVSEAAVVGYPHDIKGQGIYCLCHADGRGSLSEELRVGVAQLGTQGNWPDCVTRSDSMGPRAAENPVRQDHAPHPAQNSRKRLWRTW